jgi:hypothetical protein
MAQDDQADIPELFPEDAHGAIVVWCPSPNRRRFILRWTSRCLVAGALVAAAWSLHNYYPRIVLGSIGPAKQIQAPHVHVDQPAELSVPQERIVAKNPPVEWRPPLDTRSVVRTIPVE